MHSPSIIIGLGNVGQQYDKSRHNAGFCVLDAFATLYPPVQIKQTDLYHLAECRIDGQVFYLVKPLTFMNLSGKVIAPLKRKINLNDKNILVVVDNMDLANGRLRLKEGGGSAGQKGLQSMIEHLGSSQFYRLYVGIGRPQPPLDVTAHVLSRFNPTDEVIFLNNCERAARIIALLNKEPMSILQQLCNKTTTNDDN